MTKIEAESSFRRSAFEAAQDLAHRHAYQIMHFSTLELEPSYYLTHTIEEMRQLRIIKQSGK